jgi:hypothetical protein
MNTDQDKFWDKLSKEYLTTNQKVAIIAEYNAALAAGRLDDLVKSLAKIEKAKDNEIRIR